MQAFISWTSADRDVKNVIVQRLQEEGIFCWESDEHCFDRGECARQIRQSQVFIVVYSDAANDNLNSYVYNECIIARQQEGLGRLNIVLYGLTDAPFNDNLELELNHIPDANRVSRMQKQGGLGGIDLLVRRTKILLELREKGTPEKPTRVAVPKLKALPLGKCGYFVENSRDDLLSEMETAFERSNTLILSELSGFGKRSLVRKHVEQHQERYETALYMSANNKTVRDFLQNDLEITNVNDIVFTNLTGEALLRKKCEFLTQFDKDTVLVIDNVHIGQIPDTVMVDLLSTLNCRVVLLTQDDAAVYRDYFPLIRVGRMSDEHLQTLFFHHYEDAEESDKQALEAPLCAFFESIGGHTRTVEITASVLFREVGAYPEELVRYLDVHQESNLQLKDRIFNQIAAMFDLDTLTDDEQTALRVAALLACPKINEREYRTLLTKLGVTEYTCIRALHQRHWITIDRQNGTVSIEPLIAEICVQKMGDDWALLIGCIQHLYDQFVGITHVLFRQNIIDRAVHFFSVVDQPELATLLRCFAEENEDQITQEKTTEAARTFRNRFPTTTLTDDDDVPLSEEGFEQYVSQIGHILLPWAEISSNALLPSLMNFNTPAGTALASSDFLDVAQLTGGALQRDEMLEWLGDLKEDMEPLLQKMHPSPDDPTQKDILDLQDLSPEEAELAEDLDEVMPLYITLQIHKFFNDFYTKNYAELGTSLQDLFTLLERYPLVFEDRTIAPPLCACLAFFVNCLLVSQATEAALRLCERVLSLPMQPPERFVILDKTVSLLEKADDVPACFEELSAEALELFDRHIAATLAGQKERAVKRAELRITHIKALLRNEDIETATRELCDNKMQLAQYAAASFLAIVHDTLQQLLLDEEREIIIDFMEQILSADVCNEIEHHADEESKKSLSELQLLYEMFTTSHQNNPLEQTKAASYYDDYVAERTMPRRLWRRYNDIATRAAAIDLSAVPTEELPRRAEQLRAHFGEHPAPDAVATGFALVSEAGFRILGYRHHTEQYLAAAVMLENNIAEILNGEGKTYTVILTAFIRFLQGKCVFILDSCPHLTERNYTWMGGVLELLGVKVAHLHKDVSHEQLADADVIYAHLHATIHLQHLNELSPPHKYLDVLRYDCAIIDEADALLVDEAITKHQLVTNPPREKLFEYITLCQKALTIAAEVNGQEFYYSYNRGTIVMHPPLLTMIEQRFDLSFSDFGQISRAHEIRQLVQQAIRYRNHSTKGVDYHIHHGQICYENKRTGRFEKFSSRVEFLLQLKHSNEVQVNTALAAESTPINCTTVQQFLKKFSHIAGTTATAISYRQAFKELYGLETVCIPPHREVLRQDVNVPVFLKKDAKEYAIIAEIHKRHLRNQPVLVITSELSQSVRFSKLLKEIDLPHRLLNAENAEMIAPILASAGLPGSVLITTAMAGRGVDIKLGGDPERMTRAQMVENGMDVAGLDAILYRLPKEQQQNSPLYCTYQNLLTHNRVRANTLRQEVLESGGLCVICTEFFDDPRLEQQARGRAGRQGDVGESLVFRSMEDAIFSVTAQSMETVLSFVERTYGNIEQLNDTRLLDRTCEKLREKIYKRNLSNMQHLMWVGDLLAEFKAKYLGLNESLARQTLTPKQVLSRWLTSPEIVDYIRKLQRDTSIPSTIRTFLQEKGAFASSPHRVAAVLSESVWELVSKDKEPAEVAETIAYVLSRAWSDFLPIALDFISNTLDIDAQQYQKSVKQNITEAHQAQYTSTAEKLLFGVLDAK